MNLIRHIIKTSYLRISRILGYKLQNFQVVAGFLCFLIFTGGFLLGSADLDPNLSGNASIAEKFKLVYPITAAILTGLFTLFVNTFVNGNLVKNKDEYKDKTSILQAQQEEELRLLKSQHAKELLEFQRKLESHYRVHQELEFLSVMFQESGNLPDGLDYEVFCDPVRELRGKSILDLEELLKYLQKYIEKLKGRQNALDGLTKGFTKDANGHSPFIGLVGEACNHALGIEESQAWAFPFYSDIATYLKAWLFCSIKHGVSIPIEPFYQKSLGTQYERQYHGKQSYIKAIQYIKDVALRDIGILPYFPTETSRNIVDKYLTILIEFLSSEKNSDPANLPYSQSKYLL